MTEPFTTIATGALIGGVLATIFMEMRTHAQHKAQRAVNPLELLNENEAVRLAHENEIVKKELQRASNLINRSRNAVWMRDSKLRLLQSNLAFAELADEYEAEYGIELFKGEYALAQQVWQEGKERVVEQHIVIDGARRLYQIRIVPCNEDNCLTSYANDISETEASREEIQRHSSALRDLLESSTSATAIYGPDMRLKFYNFAFVTLWKLDDDWLDTEPSFGEVLEALRERRLLPEQANFPLFKEKQVRLFTDLIEPEEEFFFLPDGKTLRSIAIPHALGGVLFTYEDVTDRLALERSYNTLIAVQKETLDNLHEGVAVFGEDGRLKLSNPAFLNMWKLDAKHIAHEPHIGDILDYTKNLHYYEDWDSFKIDYIAQLQARRINASRLERTDGTVLDWSSVPLPDGGTLLTFINVTDSMLVERSLREKNEALQAADHLKTEFLANMSYELRSPLTSIFGFSDILRQQLFGSLNTQQMEYVQGIYESSDQLNEMIGNILDLASIEAGYLELEETPCDIEELMQDVATLFAARLKERSVSINISVSKEAHIFIVDAQRIKQVLFHLTSNAVKYTPQEGNIVMRAHIENDAYTLSVADTGVGIAANMQEKVFEGFFRGGAAQGQQSGSGLGLSMVKSIIELHGGHVTLESTPGEGTTVCCIIPLKKSAPYTRANIESSMNESV